MSAPLASPEQSRPSVRGKDGGKMLASMPRRIFQSIGLTLAALTFSSTWAGPAPGAGTSSRRITSGPPYP